MNTLPLITSHRLDDVLAWREDGPRRVRDFLADAHALAPLLPPGGALLNVCQDRYRFAVGFAAGLIAGKLSLQPASQSAETLRRIRAAYPDVVCLCDAPFDTLDLPRVDFPALPEADAETVAMPMVEADRVAAVLFTSGSTGEPQPQAKTWGKLVVNGRAEADALGFDAPGFDVQGSDGAYVLVGTVPVQHAYGFESTLLLALHGGASFWAGKPFYPHDIAAALAAVPRPRMLVTTPFHLAALLDAAGPENGLDLPPLDRVLSATAPLRPELAAAAEARLACPLHEIYGSTETGQLATRRTTDGEAWTRLPDVVLEQEGETTFASGGHIEARVALSDFIELLPGGRFLLRGRQADLVNIAGKRTSLAYLNHQIAGVPGVVDAAFFLPDDGEAAVTRLAAFVVAPSLDARQLLAALRQRVDDIFLPRPLVFVDALPRNATGKLPRAALEALYLERVAHAGR